MKKIKYIFQYLFVVLFDIIEFLYRIISNLAYKLKGKKYKYNDIIAVEYCAFIPPEVESYIVYLKGEYKLLNESYDKIVELDSIRFKEVINKIRENKLFKYKNIFSFELTRFSDLICEDGGNKEEILKIHMKDNKIHEIRSYCDFKNFDDITSYLSDL